MNALPKCPEAAEFEALFEDRLSQEQERALQEHLENCDVCQRWLERLDRDDHSASALASHLCAAPMATDTKLQVAMKMMKSPSTNGDGIDIAAGEVSLDFLSPSNDPEFIGRLGRYEISELVGRGGMGVVLKGYDPQLKRVVAIKVLAPELASNASARKRFRREGQAAAAVSHDHVVTIHGVDEASGLPHLVMEYISGRSLQNRVNQDGSLELTEILRIGMQTASGLAAAHAQGLVHRDIKPANILLENGVERVKITDFGLARAVDDVRITKPGVVTGTPEYMSPEQARGERVDYRSDLFSLGSVLYVMCTGRPAFRAENTIAMIRRVSEEIPRRIQEINNEIPDWLIAVIDKLLAKDPAQRFQSASEVAELLGQYLAHLQQPLAVPMPTVPPRHARYQLVQVRARRWLTSAAVVLVLLIGGLGMTEATGLTDVAGTVIRIVRGDGTLVIEVDDPEVNVSIDGDELVISGAGVKEIRLPAGRHELQAVKDGRPIQTKLLTITRGGREVVKVTREEPESRQLQEISEAVDRGLSWLSTQQNADGSFDGFLRNGEEGPALYPTCYATMAFLSRGHKPGQGRYGRQMSRAVEFILSTQRSDGSFSTRPREELPFASTHSLSGLTLSEVYSSTSGAQADRIGEAITGAITFSGRMQQMQKEHPAFRGGWNYAVRSNGRSLAHLSGIDTTSRELVFLRSAHNAGFEVPQAWVDEGLDFIVRCYQPGPAVMANIIANGGFAVKQHQGAFRVRPQLPADSGVAPQRWGNQWNVKRTASGMLALQLHGRRKDPMVRTSADWLAENPIPPQGSKNNTTFYYNCYISSQAMAQVGGKQWEDYFPRVALRLLPHQDRDGHWRLDVPSLPYIPRGRNTESLGPEYNTALAVLSLTIPDQLLPIHQR